MFNIKKKLREALENDIWYHGTPDVSQLEKDGGFTDKTISVEYVKDIAKFNELQDKLDNLISIGDEKGYQGLLNQVSSFKEFFTFRKPIFLTNKYDVAKTYADPHRAFNYQEAKEKVLKVNVDVGNKVTIAAHGDRFRFIELSKVKEGFVRGGINPQEFDKVVSMVNFYLVDKTKIKTDMVAMLAEWFGFDTVDVLGVLDSYNGGTVQSIVRMVFDNKKIKILN
jgi:hypothetical protein